MKTPVSLLEIIFALTHSFPPYASRLLGPVFLALFMSSTLDSTISTVFFYSTFQTYRLIPFVLDSLSSKGHVCNRP